ncbi:MAG: efflux RND transporter permease subunit [Candidatus Hydrogenedentes bacterium]|nr:efflux RND transporter permease subunit [Candidatus Hydrogenedentota bacterium]
MLHRLIALALENRGLVLLLFLLAAGFGVWRLTNLPIDAFPDTTPVQVQINTTAPALGPEEIEQQVTLPVELAVSGLPGLAEVRSVSKFGFSQVVATFTDDTSVYGARQFITERLNTVELPEGIERPQLGPIATGLGEVFHYMLHSDNPERSLEELRTLHDWVVKPELLKTPGVAEVNSWGGHEKQYHVIVRPEALIKYGLVLHDVHDALLRNNANVGGGQITRAGESLLVQGLGRVGAIAEIENIVVKAHGGAPIRVRDVAEVRAGHEIRRGAVTFQGRGEAVLGLGFMLMGENSHEVTRALRDRLDIAAEALPDDVDVTIVYDRTELIGNVIETVRHNLVTGAVLVVVVLFLLLGNIRAGIMVALTIPLAMAFAVIGMYELAIAASLLSLGAMDFGILVDGSVVMNEANLRRLREEQARLGRKLTSAERLACVIASGREVARPVAFGMGIIAVVFVPVLALQGIERKMFAPMAWAFIFALLGALAIALFLSPVLAYYLLPRNARPERRGLGALIAAVYAPLLAGALRMRWIMVATAIALVALAAAISVRLGGEFIPRLSEGAVVANVIRLAGVSVESSASYNTRIERILLDEFPNEIKYVWSRIGSAEVATDPMGTELTDVFIALNPRDEWRNATAQADLAAAFEEVLGDLPGLNIAYTQPIEMRMNEMISGIRSDLGIKVYGDDFDTLIRISDDIQTVLLGMEGAVDISTDQITGQPALQVRIDQEAIARHGVPASDVLDFVRAIGSIDAGRVYEGQRVFPLVMRLPDEFRADPEQLEKAIIPTRAGQLLPLGRLASVETASTPSTISREWSRRLIRVQANVRGRDVASFVEEAKSRIAAEVDLPDGYVLDWGGQFQNLERARLRLAIVVPVTLVLIFILLYLSLGQLRDVLVIYTGIPFAAIGGILALQARGIPFSVSAAVGFIALCGIAVLDGQVLVAAIQRAREEGAGLYDAVKAATRERLRPVLATSITDAAGFLPMALSTGFGAEVQRPLATVVVGGILSATVLTLFVLPALYVMAHGREKPPAP